MAEKKCRYTNLFLGVILVTLFPLCASAEEHPFYHMEVGVLGGASYYVGELAPHVFMSTAEAYGAQVRVKFNPRWAVQVKGQRQRVVTESDQIGVCKNPVWHLDVVGEYNFFQLGLDEYNIHMRKLTPYMSLGIGTMVYENSLVRAEFGAGAVYLPVGIGLKWKFADRWQLQLTWQHNVYLWNGDGLEGIVDANPSLVNDSYKMNGSNIMNNDVTSTLTAGVVFEFGREEKKCVFCDYNN